MGTGCLNRRPRRRSTNWTMSITRGSHVDADVLPEGAAAVVGDGVCSEDRTTAVSTPAMNTTVMRTVATISRPRKVTPPRWRESAPYAGRDQKIEVIECQVRPRNPDPDLDLALAGGCGGGGGGCRVGRMA